jgi:hypothetical protein
MLMLMLMLLVLCLQEDEPVKTAEHLQHFLHRFRIGALVYCIAEPVCSLQWCSCSTVRPHASVNTRAAAGKIWCVLLQPSPAG